MAASHPPCIGRRASRHEHAYAFPRLPDRRARARSGGTLRSPRQPVAASAAPPPAHAQSPARQGIVRTVGALLSPSCAARVACDASSARRTPRPAARAAGFVASRIFPAGLPRTTSHTRGASAQARCGVAPHPPFPRPPGPGGVGAALAAPASSRPATSRDDSAPGRRARGRADASGARTRSRPIGSAVADALAAPAAPSTRWRRPGPRRRAEGSLQILLEPRAADAQLPDRGPAPPHRIARLLGQEARDEPEALSRGLAYLEESSRSRERSCRDAAARRVADWTRSGPTGD